MFSYLLKELEIKMNETKVQSFADYFFNIKTMMTAISNLENCSAPYRTLDYFKETIKFENYLGLEYMNYDIIIKDGSRTLTQKDKIMNVLESDINDPIFKAMLVVLMNIQLPLMVSIPDRVDPYEHRHVKENMWYKLLSYIIQDGTLDKETVKWIMVLAFVGPYRDPHDKDNTKTHYTIEYKNEKMQYNDLIGDTFDKVKRYNAIAEGILEDTKLAGVYMNRRFSSNDLHLYLHDLRYENKRIPEFLSFLEFYRECKYYDEYIEAIYINCPIFNCFHDKNYKRIFGMYYRYSTDCASMKAIITDAAKMHNLLISIANDSHYYKDIISNIDNKFIDEFINLINGDESCLFSTRTMGALRRSVYEQRLNESEVEGFKLMSELADRINDKKFAKSISKYYTEKII